MVMDTELLLVDEIGEQANGEPGCPECERLRKKLKLYKDAEGFFEWAVEDAEDENELVRTIIYWIRTRQFRGLDRFVRLGEYMDAGLAEPGTVLHGDDME